MQSVWEKEFEVVSYQVWKRFWKRCIRNMAWKFRRQNGELRSHRIFFFLIPEILLSARVEQGASQEEISGKESVRRRRIPESKQESEVRV